MDFTGARRTAIVAIAAGFGMAIACSSAATHAPAKSSAGGGGAAGSDRDACDRGDGDACVRLGSLLPPGEEASAIALFARACMMGNGQGCASLARSYEEGRGVPRDDARAARLYRGACDAGALPACARLGVLLDSGRGVASDPAAAAVVFRKACSEAQPDACTALAAATALGHGVARDDAEAARLYDVGCRGGSVLACAGLGEMTFAGRGVPKDESKAAGFLRAACQRGHKLSCRELGRVLSTAAPPVRNDAEAVGLFLKGCEEDDGAACAFAAGLVSQGRGAAASASRAASLWDRSCALSHMNGCSRLGLAYMKGDGVPKDVQRGVPILDKACAGGSAAGCSILGMARSSGNGIARDDSGAQSSFRAACMLGSSTGCSRLGLSYLRPRPGHTPRDSAMTQAAADCRRTALACEWLSHVPQESAKVAFGLLVDLCDTEIPAACSALARSIGGGRVPADAASSMLAKIQRACDEGKALWCRRLGFWFEEGLSVGKDARRARGYYTSACSAGDVRACADAGRMVAAGQGGEKDIAQAIVLLTKGCDGTEAGAHACGHLGMIYVQRGQGADHATGSRLLEQACERGDGLACDRLGGFYASGSKGFRKDERLAADRFERACSLAGRACEEARRMRERIGIE